MAGDDSVDIYIRGHNGQAIRVMRDTEGRLRDMRGRFVTESSLMSGAMDRVTRSLGGVKGSIVPLAAAAAPLAAAFAPIAVKAGGAGLAVAAFGVAVAGQVSSLKEASEAQGKYEDAVVKSGRGSKQAAEAQRAAAAALAGMPEATQRAAVGLQTLKDQYRDLSDSTAKFTMAPVEKSFTVLGEILPKLTPMVKGTSEQLDRLVTVAGGAVASPGLDAYADRVSAFANSALKDAVDGIIHFSQALASGNASGPVKSFMDYAQKNGPAARETLSSLGTAVSTLVEAAAAAGPGMLTLVNAAAGLVASLPPELVTILMQTAVALKAVSLAGAGAAAIAGGVASLGTRIAALGAASAAAGGGIAGMNAALNTLSTGGKAMLAAGAVGALALVMHQLSDNKAPVAVDELTTSLNTLATTGEVTGALSANLDEMSSSIAMLSKGASDNKFVQLTSDFGTWLGVATGPGVSDATKNLDAWDKVMANNVKAGNPKLAAAQFEILQKAWKAGGGDVERLKQFTTDYSNSLKDQAFEQQMAAESMGIFGLAAADTSAKLEAQRNNADALRASIFALNDVNRSAYDSQIQFEASVDSLSASFKEHGNTLNIDTAAGQANGLAMKAAAQAHDEMIVSGVAANETFASMAGSSEKLRGQMMSLAEATLGSKAAATEYVNTLLGTPESVRTAIKLEREGAIAGLKDVQTEIAKTPGVKSIKVDTLSQAAIAALEAVGLKTRQLPDGRTEIYAENGKALDDIDAVGRAITNLNGRVATTYVQTVRLGGNSMYANKQVPEAARGGKVRGYAGGGDVQAYPDGGYIEGPGSGTSDSILTLLGSGNVVRTSNTEFIVNAEQTRKHGRLLELINSGRLPKFAKGGLTDAEREARGELRGQFGINRFGRMAGWSQNPFEKSLGAPQDMGSLVSALSKLRGDIGAATHGRTESSLLRTLDSVGKRLIGQEKALGRVNGALEKARDKLDSLKSAAASLSSSVKSGILTSANITRGGNSGGAMTVASIMGGLTESRDKGTAFAQALNDLKKAGLAPSLIQQIAEAGTEGGGLETAGALLGASGSEIASINSLQGQIGSAAGAAGKATADAVYGAAIKAQTVSVNRLQQSQDRLEKSMATLARAMEKALSRAIGKKAGGGIVGGSGRTLVGEHGPELLDLAVGSRVWSNPDSRRLMGEAAAPWASMLNTPRGSSRPARPAPSSAGGGQPIVIQLQLGKKVMGEVWVDVGQEAVRSRGSIEATLKPPRGR